MSLKYIFDFLVIVILFLGVAQFVSPKKARRGNLFAIIALAIAIGLVIVQHNILSPVLVGAMIVIGGAIGIFVSLKVDMIKIPSLVAFQHGVGAIAACIVSYIELIENPYSIAGISGLFGVVAFILGAGTFTSSMIAALKLANKAKFMRPSRYSSNWVLGLFVTVLIYSFWALVKTASLGISIQFPILFMGFISALIGILFAARIGGADMPVLISFLNATAGFAASFCGIIIGNRLLIACGAVVAASGSILTQIMCVSMNRSIFKTFFQTYAPTRKDSATEATITKSEEKKVVRHISEVAPLIKGAQKIVVVPGYGMALAQAQFMVTAFAKKLLAAGKEVKFAIHPVAGRMPGHMNVLLAEADLDYDQLIEMDDINPAFEKTDVVLVVGACDVVNTAAIDVAGTPISGMPILNVHLAKNIIICNLDDRPGYSGVPNPLYTLDKTIMLLGDAKETITKLTAAID